MRRRKLATKVLIPERDGALRAVPSRPVPKYFSSSLISSNLISLFHIKSTEFDVLHTYCRHPRSDVFDEV